MGVWMGESEQVAGSGAHYLHGNLYHWEKKMFLSVQQAEFYNTREKLQHTQTPTTTMTTSQRCSEQ